MKMVMAVVPRDEAGHVIEALVAAGYTATFSDSRGGALRQAQQTLFIAVEKAHLEQVLSIIRTSCRSCIELETAESEKQLSLAAASTAEVGGAAVFVWDLERFEIYEV
ncbi:MAG: cyclic-di-AMP receptor [Anaerolineae bacterium]|jgi:uncharacterized protein YaaQ|nr:cyclic-di-AMP receptor [Anaerolineae bacterium]MDH7474230.1 cyclic-di-AMP receptor [Anaerolineae bacterium]